MRTYNLNPHAGPEFEKRFGEALPYREKYSPLVALWYTVIGRIGQVIHVWPYQSIEERTRVRAEAMKDPHWPPKTGDIVLEMDSEILVPAPFMKPWPLADRNLGEIYEIRTYRYLPEAINEVIKRWEGSIEARETYSPLAACWHTETGRLNKWIHVWPYRDMAHRDEIRAKANKDPLWPPPTTREWMISMENKIVIPSHLSPLH